MSTQRNDTWLKYRKKLFSNDHWGLDSFINMNLTMRYTRQVFSKISIILTFVRKSYVSYYV